MDISEYLSNPDNAKTATELENSIKLVLDINGTVEMKECIESYYRGELLNGLLFEINDAVKGRSIFVFYNPANIVQPG